MKINDLDRYQLDAKEYATSHPSLDTLFIGLSSEVGELASERMKDLRSDRKDSTREAVVSEVGDILWYVSTISSAYGLSLSEIANYNLTKLQNRKETNYDR